MSLKVLNSNGIRPVSLIFPSNFVNHNDLLPKYGFRCYRSFHGEKHQLSVPKNVGGVWDMPQSLFVSDARRPTPIV